jgi:hypothetical protein
MILRRDQASSGAVAAAQGVHQLADEGWYY